MTIHTTRSRQDDRTDRTFVVIDGVSRVFANSQSAVTALDRVSIDIREGEFLSLLGPSGCGKSTLLLVVAGLIEPTEGQVVVNGTPLAGPYTSAAIVFQQDNLLEWRSVLENVVLPAEIRRLDLKQYRDKAGGLLADVGLSGFDASFPHQLSGGMRQRVSLCRALLCDLPLLLMDEPFGALDALGREEHQQMLQDIWLRYRRTVLFVTHDIREATFLSDRVVVMSHRPGKVRGIVEIDLPRPRGARISESGEFTRYIQMIRDLLGTG